MHQLQVTNDEMGRRMHQLQVTNAEMGRQTALADSIPQRTIFAWHPINLEYIGDRLKAPAGYEVCDGRNGTPNLVGRFVLGGSAELHADAFKLNEKGGSKEHEHDVTTKIALGPNPWVSGWDAK